MTSTRALSISIALAQLTACSGRPETSDPPSAVPASRPSQAESQSANTDLIGPPPKRKPAAELDPYFVESTASTSTTAPPVIVRSVLQDRHGHYWLATWNGLVRYDGTTYTNVTNERGLRRFRCFSLLEDDRGNIWTGTTGAGVYRHDGKGYINYTTEDGLAGNTVLAMMQDRNGNIWFGGEGLTRFDGETFVSYGERDGLTHFEVHSMSEAPDGSLWFGARGALFHYDGERFVNFTAEHEVDIHSHSYTPALVDRRGHVWFGGSAGLFHYDGSKVQRVFEPASFSLLEDSRGRVWFTGGTVEGPNPTTESTVLNRFDPAVGGVDNLLANSTRIGVPCRAVFDMMEDSDGVVWFGTGRGISSIEDEVVRDHASGR